MIFYKCDACLNEFKKRDLVSLTISLDQGRDIDTSFIEQVKCYRLAHACKSCTTKFKDKLIKFIDDLDKFLKKGS